MFEWEGRISDNKSRQVVKAALPYLDIPVGSIIDIEGLLRAIRNFCHQREQKMIDMFLNFFMMKRVMSMMSVMNQMSEAGDAGAAGNSMDGMLNMLKSQMPKEQQDMFDMVSMMMSAMADGSAENNGEENSDDGPGGHFQEHASSESPDYPGVGDEDQWEGYEEYDAAYYGSDAEAEDAQPFVFPAGGYGPFRNLDKGHESCGEAEGRNDETSSEQ